MTTAVAAVVLVVIISVAAASAAPVIGLDAFLAQQSHLDPLATNDTFVSLPSTIKSSLSHNLQPLSSTINSLLSLSVPISVHIKLIGSSFSSLSPSHLTSFLTSTHLSDHFHIISPFRHGHHRLAVKHVPHFDVTVSPLSLAKQLSEKIQSEIAKTPTNLRSTMVTIDYDAVDQIVRGEFDKEKPVDGIYLYLINLGQQSKSYAYSYGPGDASVGYAKCSGTIWTGKERYVWIDLGAGPVDYGPGLSGDGVLPRGESHPLAAAHGRPKSEKAMLADVASLVASAYQVLLTPSLRIPVPFENSLVVQFVHIYGSGGKDLNGLDWKEIEKSFVDEAGNGGLLLGDQKLTFKSYSVDYTECAVCAFAISRSTNSYTSRFLFDNYTLIVSEYLDSKRLHQVLSDSAEQIRGAAGIPEEEHGRVLPVYVFDLDYSSLLMLDRYHQSVSFKDMVIAVRTKNSQTVSDYSCNGRHVFTHTRELERPLIGSILQSMWGVAPTHLSWSPRHNNTLVDYTWSVGQTPFGPFSEVSSLSFVQKDAAKRNFLLTFFNYSITSAVDVLDSVVVHGGDRSLLKQNGHAEFLQRLNLFKHKLDRAVSALSHLDFGLALYFLRSSDHDLYAIHSIVYQATEQLEATLTCFKDPPFPWGSVGMSIGVFVSISYAYLKRDKLFRNKRKQF
ncbi:unnamed protein product [Rhodiola kirilowii]